jgi:hypothetical protein
MDAHDATTVSQPDDRPAPLLTRQGRRNLLGLGLSLLIHVFLLGLLALVLLEGPRGPEGRVYGPAVEVQTGDMNAQASEAEEWLDESLPDLADAVPMPEISPTPAQTELSIVSAGGGAPASLAGGAGAGEADGMTLGGAASGGASFFGVEASGSRIVYIVDVSGSMLHNGKIEALRRELLGSFTSLPPGSEFAVIAFSDEASTRVLGGALRWRDAGASGRAEVETAVRGLAPSGGTEPLEAFRLAFQLEPKPEAIYFMTDGVLPQNQAARIIGTVRVLNESTGPTTPIHCIAFESREGAQDLRRIARQSSGTYTYVAARRR